MSPSDFVSYFIHNMVLSRGDYSKHAARTWEMMQKDPNLKSNEAINQYLRQLVAEYKSEHGTTPNVEDVGNRLKGEIDRLLVIEKEFEGINPTPTQIADNYIENRASKINGVTQEELTNIRDAIIEYESAEITPENTVKAMQSSWTKNGMFDEQIDHYTDQLKNRIEHYKSENFDPATACARAAVDIRAQVDRDRGAVPSTIIDEHHSFYQGDIQKMGDFIRKKAFAENRIEQAKENGIEMDEKQALHDIERFRYLAHRGSNLEQTVQNIYMQGPDALSPEEARLNTQAEAAVTSVSESYLYRFLPGGPSKSIEDHQFRKDADTRHDRLQESFDGDSPTEKLQAGRDLSVFIRDGMEARELSFVKENWDELHPYFERVDESVAPDDFEHGLSVLRDKHDEIVDKTYDHRGGRLRGILRDMRAFEKLEDVRSEFDKKINEIDAFAKENDISLEGMEQSAAQPNNAGLSAEMNNAASPNADNTQPPAIKPAEPPAQSGNAPSI